MKDTFYGYYPPEMAELNDVWADSIVALDANALLNLYRYTKNTKDDFIKILHEYSSRLWLPHQAGYEFHSNRISVIKSQESAYSSAGKDLDESLKSITETLAKYNRHPFIKPDLIVKQIQTSFTKTKAHLATLSDDHPKYLHNDDILLEITDLFTGKIGKSYCTEELDKIYNDGEKRYSKNIPPGFSDRASKKNNGNQHLYGDYIIWKQLIEHSKKSNKPIIFITDDRKEDWWHKYKGETIRPREELVKEFYDETGFRILIYQADIFLQYANKQRQNQIKEKTIAEVKSIRLEDERKYINLYDLQSKFGISDNNNLSFNRSDGVYINPIYPLSLDIMKNNPSLYNNLGLTPSWPHKLNPTQSMVVPPNWMADVETRSKAFAPPEWLNTLGAFPKFDLPKPLMKNADSLSKLQPSNDWISDLSSNPITNPVNENEEDAS